MKNYPNYRRQHRKKPIAEINVVPYIDVMLVLLVIFMITAPLLTQGVNVNLPKAQAKAIAKKNELPIIVSIDSAGRYFINAAKHPTHPISAQSLMTQIAARVQLAKQLQQPVTIYVKGDRFVNYGKVVYAMTLLQKAGATNVGLITQSEQINRQIK